LSLIKARIKPVFYVTTMGLMGRWMASVDSASNRGDWPLIGVPTVGGAPASLDKSLQESEPEIGSGNGHVF